MLPFTTHVATPRYNQTTSPEKRRLHTLRESQLNMSSDTFLADSTLRFLRCCRPLSSFLLLLLLLCSATDCWRGTLPRNVTNRYILWTWFDAANYAPEDDGAISRILACFLAYT